MFIEIIKQKLKDANKLIVKEFESERAHHQKLVKEHARLQQRLENLQGEMKVLTSPQGPGHSRTPSNISMESYTSSVLDTADKSPSEEEEADRAVGNHGNRIGYHGKRVATLKELLII